MNIDKNNYQEYFLLYTDNELMDDERKAVEKFVHQHQDLKDELLMLQHAILKPEEEIVFMNKGILLQFEDTEHFIYPGNFEEYAVAYFDNELSAAHESRLEAFVLNNPDFQEEFDLLQSLKFIGDDAIIYPDKRLLYHYKKERKPISFLSWKMAAAAVVLLFAGLLLLNKRSPFSLSPDLTKIITSVPLKNTDAVVTKKSGNGSVDNTIVPTDTFIDKPARQVESFVVSDKRSIRTNKKHAPLIAISKRVSSIFVTDEAEKIQHNGNELIARVKQRLPSSVVVSAKTQTEPIGSSATPAALEATVIGNNKITNQPVLKINATDNQDYSIVKTVAHTSYNENDLLTDISTGKKNPLREILRKATRFIDKNTAFRTSKKSGILIGNIEIAFQ